MFLNGDCWIFQFFLGYKKVLIYFDILFFVKIKQNEQD